MEDIHWYCRLCGEAGRGRSSAYDHAYNQHVAVRSSDDPYKVVATEANHMLHVWAIPVRLTPAPNSYVMERTK